MHPYHALSFKFFHHKVSGKRNSLQDRQPLYCFCWKFFALRALPAVRSFQHQSPKEIKKKKCPFEPSSSSIFHSNESSMCLGCIITVEEKKMETLLSFYFFLQHFWYLFLLLYLVLTTHTKVSSNFLFCEEEKRLQASLITGGHISLSFFVRDSLRDFLFFLVWQESFTMKWVCVWDRVSCVVDTQNEKSSCSRQEIKVSCGVRSTTWGGKKGKNGVLLLSKTCHCTQLLVLQDGCRTRLSFYHLSISRNRKLSNWILLVSWILLLFRWLRRTIIMSPFRVIWVTYNLTLTLSIVCCIFRTEGM